MSAFRCVYCLIKIEALWTKKEEIDQTHLDTGLKTQSVEELSLCLLFHNNFW